MGLHRSDVNRRKFLQSLAATLAAFLGAAAGVPLIGAVIAPGVRRDEPQWVPLGGTNEFVVGQPRMISFGVEKADGYVRSTLTRAVWAHRPTADALVVYSARCTHLGCLVSYRADSRTFFCPCHGGVFALGDGHVLEGPPPRALDRLSYRLDGDRIMVQYRDFLVGVPEQVPL